ncbi:MAG TPA: type I DNA topoisomerase [Abditibacteriaceae bacterium]|nr:type I DNA topoisomerase [Abditibacteriaceae bacterium]
MAKSLLIVESPTKVKTLKGFLGPDFIIKGSQGHVRDLPKSGLAVDIENDFKPDYELLADRKHIIQDLKKAAGEVDQVYLASDPDREGEAIAWHIREALKLKKVLRIEFNEITKIAVQRALAHPREIDMDRVNAQQARRVLDRIIGYKLSPLLARKINKGLSAGRVQSVAVRLVCEREREIQAFKTEEYWSITALLSPQTEDFPFPAKLLTRAGKKLAIGNEAEAKALVDALRPLLYAVDKVQRQEKRRFPAAPFITSTLQQEASKQLYFPAKRVMKVAQELYEGVTLGGSTPVGLITYMRTDSTTIAKEAQASARELIGTRFGPEYVPDTPPQYKNRKSAQEAHEAVRPSDVTCVPEEIQQYLSPDQFKLYRLIWRRFVASQMKPAVLDVTTVDIKAGEFGLRASGSIIKFPGFLSVYEEAKDEDKTDEVEPDDENAERKLPSLIAAQPLDLRDLLPKQHFTQPPPRYTEATLVKALEENGIGRPSTYAQIMSTIQDRKYVELEQRRFKPTDLGFLVNDKLVLHFPEVVDVQFTAGIEEKLDEVEEGKQDWVGVLRAFYDPFSADLLRANTEMEKVAPVETDFDCPVCGKKLVLRRGRFGEFFSCSNYPECKTAMNVGPSGEPVEKVEKVALVVEGIEPGATRECDKCGKPMVVRSSRRGAFWGCTAYPKCRNLIAIEGAVAGVPEAAPIVLTEYSCPNCGKPMAERRGRFGPFLGCTGYPECKTLINLDKDGNPREAAVTGAVKDSKDSKAVKRPKATKSPPKKATVKRAKAKPVRNANGTSANGSVAKPRARQAAAKLA